MSNDTPRTPGNGRHAPPATPATLWRTKDDTCEALEVSARTLNRLVASGRVERRQSGRRAVYRILSGTPPATPAPETHANAPRTPRGGGSLALAPDTAPEPEPSPEVATLADLVNQLTSDLVRSERDRGEAVGIGHAIADERDRLRADLDALRAELLELAGTSRAWTVRRRLLAAVKPRTVH